MIRWRCGLPNKNMRAHFNSFFFVWTYCFVLIKNVPDADMENVRNVTKLRLFIYRFYPKVCELHQYQNLNKTASFNCKYNVNNIYIFTSCLIRHNKSHRLSVVEMRVLAVQAWSAESVLPVWASWSTGSLPCWPWRQSSILERILVMDSP